MSVISTMMNVISKIYTIRIKAPSFMLPTMVTAVGAIPIVWWVAEIVTTKSRRSGRMNEAAAAKSNEMLQNLAVVREFAREEQE